MQKRTRNRSQRSHSGPVLSFVCISLLSLTLSSFGAAKVTTISFKADDGLEVTADEYITDISFPYILLFHEQGSSRGEFQIIAQRLSKMNYNCLAVDTRNGGNNNSISNETAKRCRESRCLTGIENIETDMLAAIEYIAAKSNRPVILFGSGANGSLCLKMARENDQVRAVVALSPGEYFLPGVSIQDTIADLEKPVFITSSSAEFPFVSQLASGVNENYLTLFEPQLGDGERGSAALNPENHYNSEYWLALLLFFKDLM